MRCFCDDVNEDGKGNHDTCRCYRHVALLPTS
jgi:hypothetical protein